MHRKGGTPDGFQVQGAPCQLCEPRVLELNILNAANMCEVYSRHEISYDMFIHVMYCIHLILIMYISIVLYSIGVYNNEVLDKSVILLQCSSWQVNAELVLTALDVYYNPDSQWSNTVDGRNPGVDRYCSLSYYLRC